MDLNYDPRDETEIRPQVGFRLKAGGYDEGQFFHAVLEGGLHCHDLMTFDATDGEVPGVVRFDWDTPSTLVDATAERLRSLPYVLKVFPAYGGPIDASRAD